MLYYKTMVMDKNIMYVIAFFLGMLIFHLLKDYCGCNNVVEGQAGTCECVSPVCGDAGDTSQGTIDGQACAAVTDEDLNDATVCDAIMTSSESDDVGTQACSWNLKDCSTQQQAALAVCAQNCGSCDIPTTTTTLNKCKWGEKSQVGGPGGTFCNATGCCPV